MSGKPLCPALHNIKMRVSSKKSFTLLKCIFFACLSMTQDRTTTYRVTTCATATRLSLVVWHVWRFLVRYNNRGRRRRVDQNDRFSSPFSSTSNRRSALKLGTTDLRGLRNTLVQKKIRNLSPPKITLLIGPPLPAV